MHAEIAPVLWPPPLSDASACVEALEVLANMHDNTHRVSFLGTVCGPPGCGKSTALRACASSRVSLRLGVLPFQNTSRTFAEI